MTADGKHPTTPVVGNPPHTDKAGFRKAYCDYPTTPTLPKYAWTMNIHAEEGSEEDSYRFNPVSILPPHPLLIGLSNIV